MIRELAIRPVADPLPTFEALVAAVRRLNARFGFLLSTSPYGVETDLGLYEAFLHEAGHHLALFGDLRNRRFTSASLRIDIELKSIHPWHADLQEIRALSVGVVASRMLGREVDAALLVGRAVTYCSAFSLARRVGAQIRRSRTTHRLAAVLARRIHDETRKGPPPCPTTSAPSLTLPSTLAGPSTG